MPNDSPAHWLARAQAFRADDPDPETQRELDALLLQGDSAELRDRFSERLAFGTAGLRGLIGAGDNRMNRRVVAQTSAGLCAYLLASSPTAQQRGLCVAFDARHKSREFAEEVIAIACGAGFVVHAFESVTPTPLLAFAVLDRAAVGGVMITASHNPAAYNGYKVYLADGAQLLEPHDARIARASLNCGPVLTLPRLTREAALQAGLLRSLDDIEARYLARLGSELKPQAPQPELRVAYTAMHGVGEHWARAALQLAGARDVHSVAAQATPDATFPTVAFPNPEEPGALDMLLELGNAVQAQIALANDPDADRLAVAARTATNELQVLTGNELGVLLTDYLLTHAASDGKNLVVSSIVSTPLVGKICHAHAAHWETTLTGFKWIVQRGLELQAQAGLRMQLGFEEALGYCVGSLVHDKDGIAAAAHTVRMAAWHASRGASLHDALEALYRRHGLFESRQLSITLSGPAGVAKLEACMQRLRAQPPSSLAERPVTQWLDLEAGICVRGTTRSATTLPNSNVLSFELENSQRITIRPSGTEPKLKIYLDCVTVIAPDEPIQVARTRVQRILDDVARDFLAQAGLESA
jgi:phosphomannomutase